jgi:hypothetical protein
VRCIDNDGVESLLTVGRLYIVSVVLRDCFIRVVTDDLDSGSFLTERFEKELPPAADTKATNPKDAIGSDKLPMHLAPPVAVQLMVLGLLDGALKYGRSNWREAGVRFTVYYDAIRRHVDALLEGEDNDPDSGLPHLAHILATAAIIADAQAAGKLTDDRNKVTGRYRESANGLTTHVARLKALHAHRNPKHYTIADKEAA